MKLAILREWEQDARRLSASEGEGFCGGEESMLGRVEHATLSFNEKPEAVSGQPR